MLLVDTTGTAVFGSSMFCFVFKCKQTRENKDKIRNGYIYTTYIFNVNKSSMILWFLAVPRGDLAEEV